MRRLRALLVGVAFSFVASSPVQAEEPAVPQRPPAPPPLATQASSLMWANDTLRASVGFQHAMTPKVVVVLRGGLPIVVALRAAVVPTDQAAPVAVSVQACRIVFDLWDEDFRVDIVGQNGKRSVRVPKEADLGPLCFEMTAFPIVERAQLSARPHFVEFSFEVLGAGAIPPELVQWAALGKANSVSATPQPPTAPAPAAAVSLRMRSAAFAP